MDGSVGSMYSSRAYANWSNIWFKEHWLGTFIWILSILPAIFVPVAFVRELGKGPFALSLVVAISAWLAIGIAGYVRTQSQATWEEIEAIRPLLGISESQQLYLDCVKAVLDSRVLEESQKGSWLASLNASLDQAIELDKVYAGMKDSLGGLSVTELDKERERLQSRMNAASDPVSKEIFRQSLEMAEDRMNRSDGIAGQIERAEAHLELTRQTFIKTRETLQGLEIGTKQSTRIDLEPLRANLANVQSEAHAIRAAIDELAQLRHES